MNTMKMPGFTAEYSDYRSNNSYYLSKSIPTIAGITPAYICGTGTCPIHRCCVGGDCIPCRIVRPRLFDPASAEADLVL